MPSFSDRHLAMADELREVLADRLPPATTVSRSYAPDAEMANWPTGKTVWVFPTSEEDAERISRKRLVTEYGFIVVITERYETALRPTGGEPVPTAWVDDRCGWVHENVYTPLNDSVRKADRLIPTAWPQTCRIAVKYDPDRLQAGGFWSSVEVSMREEREG